MKIGFQEIIVIFIVIFLVIGPDKMPEFSRKIGKGLKAFRKYTEEATKDIRESVVDPVKEAEKPIREAMEPLNDAVKPLNDAMKPINDAVQPPEFRS